MVQEKTSTVIVHDTFLYRGGGERLVMYMRDILQCDLVSGFFDVGSYSQQEILHHVDPQDPHPPQIIALTKSTVFTKGVRHLKLKAAFLFRTHFLRQYDTVIFSGDCLAARRHVQKGAKKIFYCHTPPRYIFDKRDWYEDQIQKHYGAFSPMVLPVYRYVRSWFERSYRADISAMDRVVVNSSEVQKRVQKYFQIQADIIHPPVDISKFSSTETGEKQEEYFLFFGRLAAFKRVDVIIQAFKQLPEKQLKITYGANDPVVQELMDLAAGYDNITFLTDVSDEQAVQLLTEATATIYIPKDEDFGMVPIESMACGTPVIGVNE